MILLGLKSYDVVIVGGGPAGLMAAWEAARQGLSTAVFEEDKLIGRPEKCAGLYSVDGLEALGIPLKGPYLETRVRGAVFVSPSGRRFDVDAGREVAVVCNRERFDQYIAEKAVDAGAELYLGEGVRKVYQRNGVTLETCSSNVSTRKMIVAEGRLGTISKQTIPSYRLGRWLPIVQHQVSNHGLDTDMVYLYFRRYIPEFFGYFIPVDEKIGKIGVAASRRPDVLLSKLMTEFFPKAKIIGSSSSAIYVGRPLPKPMHGDVIVVGDAAGQVKATTGGGVVYGGIAGRLAALHTAKKTNYLRKVKHLHRELEQIYFIRKMYESILPKHLDALFQAIDESNFNRALSEGDMDRHMTTIARTAVKGSLVKLFLYYLRHLLRG